MRGVCLEVVEKDPCRRGAIVHLPICSQSSLMFPPGARFNNSRPFHDERCFSSCTGEVQAGTLSFAMRVSGYV